MHLLIPHASALDEAARHAFASLALPHLSRQLSRLTATETWGTDEFAPHPPHHVALAALRGQSSPSAAAWAAAAGPELAWALMTPVHLSVGTDGVDVLPPAALQLSESEAARIVSLLQALWPQQHGWQWRILDATRWAIGHPDALDGLQAPSIERVAGRPIEPWLPDSRVLRRWQNEAQMLLHGCELNAEREHRGELPVNSVWIGDIGRARAAASEIQVDTRLTAPLLAGDLAAWADAWQQLDAGPLAQPLDSLTLCGERLAVRFTAQPLPWWERLGRRWRSPDAATTLGAL